MYFLATTATLIFIVTIALISVTAEKYATIPIKTIQQLL